MFKRASSNGTGAAKKPSLIFGAKKASSASKGRTFQINGLFAQSSSKDAWWRLDEHLQLADQQPSEECAKSGVYLSFSASDDLCIPVGKSRSEATKTLIGEIGETVFTKVLQVQGQSKNESSLVKKLRAPWLYATAKSRIGDYPENLQIVSGQAAMRCLLASKAEQLEHIEAPFVTGILFQGASNQKVLILMQCNEDGELSNVDYMPLNQMDPLTALRSYVQSMRLSASGEWTQERTAIFSSDELLNLALKPYPKEAEYFGLPESKLNRVLMLATGTAMACSVLIGGGVVFYNYNQKAITQDGLARAKAIKAEMADLLSGQKLLSLMERRTVDVDTAIEKASAIWQPGSVVSIKATPESLTLTSTLKIASPDQSPEGISKALSMKTPDGCTRQFPATTTQINELYLTYECQTPDALVQRINSLQR